MEISHRISFNSLSKKSLFETIRKMGRNYKISSLPGGGGELISFDIFESDVNWPIVSELIDTWDAVDIEDTVFTDQEINNAQWLRLIPVHQIGYPQPQKTWQELHPNYQDYCRNCGTYHQRSEFQIRDDSFRDKAAFTSLYWTYTILAIHDVISQFDLLKFTGFESRDVLLEGGKPSGKIRQLYIPNIAPAGLGPKNDLRSKKCTSCGITKFEPHMRGAMYFNQEALKTDLDFIQTYEWFGSGKSAFREILVTNRVANLITQKKWSGVRLKVVEIN
jgi:hypothetical protein